MMKNKKVLVVAAHPDDEVLGCGGTTARLVKEGWVVETLILGEGVTARDDKRVVARRKSQLEQLNSHAEKANVKLGVTRVYREQFPDNRFDSFPLLDLIKKIERVVERVNPQILFTHYENDLNIDHQMTYRAVITATRPMLGQAVREIYSFEVMSSTEWRYPLSFSPDYFVDVSSSIDKKIAAMKVYKGELRKYPHPRSIRAIKETARNWGIKVGMDFSEAFMTVRVLK
ncbi:PIG-L deacetylase family protein [Pseudomonadota bacterium]